jgi:hypothetical protein
MRTLPILLGTFLCLIAGCSKQDANAASKAPAADATKTANEISTILTDVKDSDGAKKAADKLNPLVTSLSGLLSQLQADAAKPAGDVKDLANNAAKKVSSALSPELSAAFAKISEQVKRISANPELMAPLKDILAKLEAMIPK